MGRVVKFDMLSTDMAGVAESKPESRVLMGNSLTLEKIFMGTANKI